MKFFSCLSESDGFFFSENNILKSNNTDIIKTTDFLVIVSQCFFVALELVLIFSCFTKKI